MLKNLNIFKQSSNNRIATGLHLMSHDSGKHVQSLNPAVTKHGKSGVVMVVHAKTHVNCLEDIVFMVSNIHKIKKVKRLVSDTKIMLLPHLVLLAAYYIPFTSIQ